MCTSESANKALMNDCTMTVTVTLSVSWPNVNVTKQPLNVEEKEKLNRQTTGRSADPQPASNNGNSQFAIRQLQNTDLQNLASAKTTLVYF
jgi:hypothetical protein